MLCVAMGMMVVAAPAVNCTDAVPSFVDNSPKELSDVDLVIARLRLLPFYQRKCKLFATELDAYEARLERERRLRRDS